MTGHSFGFWDQDAQGQTPADLEKLIGLKVRRAWLLPGRTSLMLLLEKNQAILISPVKTVGMRALEIETGNTKPGADWSYLDRECPYDRHLYELEGLPFGGLSGDVVVIGDKGAQIMQNRHVRWVKRP